MSSDGGTTWSDVTTSDATTWSFTDPTVHGASFTYQARVIDAAANVGNSDSQAVTIDTSNPTAAVAITAIADDTGTAGDFTTSDTTLTVSGTHGALGAGEKVQVSSDGGTTWSDVTTSDATTWSFTDPTVHGASFTYQARVIDAAANVGNSDSQAVTIDTSDPTAAVAITAIADDTGTAGDFTTSDTTLTVSGITRARRRREGAGEQRRRNDLVGRHHQRRHHLELHRSHRPRRELHLPGAGDRCGGQCRQQRQPGGHHRHQHSDGGGGDHRDRRRHRHRRRLQDQRHHADRLGHSTVRSASREDPDQQRRRIDLERTSPPAHATSWSFDDPATVTASSLTYQARVIDAAANVGNSDSGVTIDTSNPTAAVAITAIADDTGTAGDFTTSDTTLTVSGTHGALGAGEKVQVSSDGGNDLVGRHHQRRHHLELHRSHRPRRELPPTRRG